MARIVVLNGSPRAPKSNSKRYAGIFSSFWGNDVEYFNITKGNHKEICGLISDFDHILFVFPLYADGIPVTFLNFLKTLETCPPVRRPVVSVIVNCGFLEYTQNDAAVKMVQLFCRKNGYRMGSVLKIGSGEAILDSPFRFLAERKIKEFALSVNSGKYRTLHTAMPLPKRIFVKASTKYWIEYGKKHGVSKEEMQTMEIESSLNSLQSID